MRKRTEKFEKYLHSFIPQKKITFNPNGAGADSSHTLKMAIFP